MDCPNCGLINPPDAQRCDCGYDFEAARLPRIAGAPAIARARAARDAGSDFNGLDLGDAADPSEVWDNCDLLGCPPDCDGIH